LKIIYHDTGSGLVKTKCVVRSVTHVAECTICMPNIEVTWNVELYGLAIYFCLISAMLQAEYTCLFFLAYLICILQQTQCVSSSCMVAVINRPEDLHVSWCC